MRGYFAVAQIVLLGIMLLSGGAASAEPKHPLETAGIYSPLMKEPLDTQSAPRLFSQKPPWTWSLVPQAQERKWPLLHEEAEAEQAWRPLSEAEIRQREKELAGQAVTLGAELADSLFLSQFSEGILWTSERFNATQRHLAEHYRLHLDLSDDNATLTYNIQY